MHPQLFVLVIQPDVEIGRLLVCALAASGHQAELVSAASWAVPLVRDEPPDVILLERSAHGFELLLDAIDDLRANVPVLVSRFAAVPPAFRHPDAAVVAAIVRRAEAAASQGY
jgi:DNA-binding NtrC family response regulator